MPKSHEPPPGRGSKIRGGLPGNEWRKYVSAGAEKAYDYPLATQRQEASDLRKKGRLIAAHRKEKASYRIRVRGYARKKKGLAPVEKAWTKEVRRIGPYSTTRTRLSLKPKTKWEKSNDTIRAVGQGFGGIRTVAAIGGGAAIGEKVLDSKKKAQKMVTGYRPDTENKVVGKSLTIDDINKAYLPVRSRRMDIDFINKGVSDQEYQYYLEEIMKMSGLWGALKASPLGQLGQKYGQAAIAGYQHKGIAGAQHAVGQISRYGGGGLEGIGRAAQQTWQNPAVRGAIPGKALGIGAGAAGGAALGYGAYRGLAKPFLKKKAKKYALIGAAGLGGTVAAGTALGNQFGNR